MSGRPAPVPCPNNENVFCSHTADCETCGWNPEVEARRMRKIRQELGIEEEE